MNGLLESLLYKKNELNIVVCNFVMLMITLHHCNQEAAVCQSAVIKRSGLKVLVVYSTSEKFGHDKLPIKESDRLLRHMTWPPDQKRGETCPKSDEKAANENMWDQKYVESVWSASPWSNWG